jgi:hypothetical protein
MRSAGGPAQLEVAEHHRLVVAQAHDRVARALGLVAGAHAVGAGEVIDEQGVGAFLGDEGVDPREVATGAGERAAVAVAADEESALQLLAVDVELAGDLAAALGLGRLQ